MHDDDLRLSDQLISRLLAHHAPQWAGRPVERLPSPGTDNALYRLGPDLLLRLPRRRSAIDLIRKEMDWLPAFQELPLRVPNLRLRGSVDIGVPCDFGIFEWLEGDIATPDRIADPKTAAVDLAAFLHALHRCDTANAPRSGLQNNQRGIALDALSSVARLAIDMLADEIDATAACSLWQFASSLPLPAKPVWLHGDLKADNLLVSEGRLNAVIDWGLSAVGDPAADYAAAWTWIAPHARDAFRQACDLDDSDWLRAKGWALYGAVVALSYYRGGRNEALCRQSRLTLQRLGLLKT